MSRRTLSTEGGMDTLQIESCVKSDLRAKPYFKGVFAADQLPRQVPYPSLYIANTKPARHRGEHWVGFFFGQNREAEYFDSLGRPPRTPWHRDFLKRNSRRYVASPHRIQSLESELCGQYCVMYALYRARGVSLFTFLNRFSPYDFRSNDALVETWFERCFSGKPGSNRMVGQGCCKASRVS